MGFFLNRKGSPLIIFSDLDISSFETEENFILPCTVLKVKIHVKVTVKVRVSPPWEMTVLELRGKLAVRGLYSSSVWGVIVDKPLP